jgi:signal transduction histidine kinase
MPSLPTKKQAAVYIAVVTACFAVGAVAGLFFGTRIDLYFYDLMTARMRAEKWTPQSVVVAIDEATFEKRGGPRKRRAILAEALGKIAAAQPRAVAIDMILHDQGDPVEDATLEEAMRVTSGLILSCEVVNGKWEEPLARFRAWARGVGQVNLESDRRDGVSREIPLEQIAPGDRRWALSLEAFRQARGSDVLESPDDVQVGGVTIPARRREGGRPMYVRYLRSGIPTIDVLQLGDHPEVLRGKTVFLGETALSSARDRVMNSFGEALPGVAVHAHAYETIARGKFLVPAGNLSVLGTTVGLAVAAGLTFALLSGWQAYAAIVLVLIASAGIPIWMFPQGVLFPFAAPVGVAWLCSAGAATYQHFFVRKQLRRSESEKSRYQQAIHWAAHEMRTPLTAIQGSSEILSRYKLPEAKQHQLSEMINSESKRLSRIITTFLDVERLAEGQMEMKREPFGAASIVDSCLLRIRPIAERKNIGIHLDTSVEGTLVGDRELMEYALYNLLTNAVKYSPADTEVHVSADLRGEELRLAVRDQGIGMDAKEVKQVFKKFYRTKRAEASGEVGTGIGLSIVEQIVQHHGGRIDVTSTPGEGSCFTMVLRIQPASNAETVDRGR